MRIHRMTCRVTIVSRERKLSLHAEPKPVRAAQRFEMPLVMEPAVASDPVVDAPEEAMHEEPIRPAAADPRKVADRVYDLMRREAQLARERGAFGGR